MAQKAYPHPWADNGARAPRLLDTRLTHPRNLAPALGLRRDHIIASAGPVARSLEQAVLQKFHRGGEGSRWCVSLISALLAQPLFARAISPARTRFQYSSAPCRVASVWGAGSSPARTFCRYALRASLSLRRCSALFGLPMRPCSVIRSDPCSTSRRAGNTAANDFPTPIHRARFPGDQAAAPAEPVWS